MDVPFPEPYIPAMFDVAYPENSLESNMLFIINPEANEFVPNVTAMWASGVWEWTRASPVWKVGDGSFDPAPWPVNAEDTDLTKESWSEIPVAVTVPPTEVLVMKDRTESMLGVP